MSESNTVQFHYVVTSGKDVRWFETKAAAERWIASHRTESGKYVLAHHRADALKRAV